MLEIQGETRTSLSTKQQRSLLRATKKALEVAESYIHDQLDGTSSLKGALATLAPVRKAIRISEKTLQK